MKHSRLILGLWVVLICCVVVGSLLPASSAVMVAVGRLHVSDRVLHFCAYVALSLLPVIGSGTGGGGLIAGFSMFVLGLVLEGAQQIAPGRGVEYGDVIANGAGVSCGVLLAPPIRMLIAIL